MTNTNENLSILPEIPGHRWQWFDPKGGRPINYNVAQLMTVGGGLSSAAAIVRNVDGTWRAEGRVKGMSAILAGGFQKSLTFAECGAAIATHMVSVEDPRNPAVVHYAGPDKTSVCGLPSHIFVLDRFHRLVNFGDGDDATCSRCIAYAKRVIEDAAAEHREAAAQAEGYESAADKEREEAHAEELDHDAAPAKPRAYEPSATVLGLIAFYRTQMQRLHATAGAQTKSGFLRAVREAVRIEARTQNLVLTDGELTAWVRQHLS